MGKATLKDVYGNRAFEQVTQAAANDLTFEQIQFGVGLFQGIAMVISRVEWFPSSIAEIVAASDRLEMALTNRDDLSDLSPTNQNVLVKACLAGAAIPAVMHKDPVISDLSTLPGGGLIIPANPLYMAVKTAGYAAAATINAIIYFVFRQLADSEYIELIQTIMPANL